MENSVVHLKAEAFAHRIVAMHSVLKERKLNHNTCDQILRSGTAIGANLAEAKYGISKKDFAQRIGIALREASETEYWLGVIKSSNHISKVEYDSMVKDCRDIKYILAATVKTLKENLSKR